jgi:hypothetical protein
MARIELTDEELAYLKSLLSEAQESLEDSLQTALESITVQQELAATNSKLAKLVPRNLGSRSILSHA